MFADDGMIFSNNRHLGRHGWSSQQRQCCTRDQESNAIAEFGMWTTPSKKYPKCFGQCPLKVWMEKGDFIRLGILVGGTQKRCNLNAESNLMHIHQFSLMLSEKSQMGKKKLPLSFTKKDLRKRSGKFPGSPGAIFRYSPYSRWRCEPQEEHCFTAGCCAPQHKATWTI